MSREHTFLKLDFKKHFLVLETQLIKMSVSSLHLPFQIQNLEFSILHFLSIPIGYLFQSHEFDFGNISYLYCRRKPAKQKQSAQ